MRIVFVPQVSDIPRPSLSVVDGALMNAGDPIEAPYLIASDPGVAVVLLPITTSSSDAERYPLSVNVVSGPVPLPQQTAGEPDDRLSKVRWTYMKLRTRIIDELDDILRAAARREDVTTQKIVTEFRAAFTRILE